MGRRRKEETSSLKNGMQATLKSVKSLIPAKDSKLYPYVGEKETCYTTNIDEYKELINEVENCTSRAMVSTDDISFVASDEKMYKKLITDVPQDIVDDAIANGCNVIMKKGHQNYIVSGAGMDTIWRIVNANREKIPAYLQASLFNHALGCKGNGGRDVVAVAQEGKILGIMSKVYTPYPPNEIIALVEKAVKDAYGDNVACVGAYFDHVRYEVEYRITGEEATSMTNFLKEQLTMRAQRLGVMNDYANLQPTFGFVVRTGETGNDTVSIRAKISTNDSLGGLLVGQNITIYHKGEKDIADIIEKKFNNLFAMFQDSINNLIQAADIKVLDWRSCIVNLAEFAKIPEEIWKKMVVDFAEKYDNPDVVTGFDILSAFMDSSSIYTAINPQATQTMRDMYNVKIDIVISQNVSDFDNNEAEVRKALATQEIRYPELVLEGAVKELKIPVNVVKRLRETMATKRTLFAMTNPDEEQSWKALDIYELIANSTTYMKNWYVEKKGLSGDELDEKMAAYAKVLAKAKDVCYVVYDKETA